MNNDRLILDSLLCLFPFAALLLCSSNLRPCDFDAIRYDLPIVFPPPPHAMLCRFS